jgi:large subunit ribosomal protein L3
MLYLMLARYMTGFLVTMKFILGEKIEMTQRFHENGQVVPVTVVKVGPCPVTQVKTKEKDGYDAVQVGYGKKKHVTMPIKGHLKELGELRYLKEFTPTEAVQVKRGDQLTVDMFEVGDIAMVTGQSKGKGFQGVVRRHGFHGSPASHGHKDQLRMPGSIGSTGPQRVVKGRRMAGHMGDEQVSVKNLEIIDVDPANSLLYLKGAVPGARHGLLSVVADGELKLAARAVSAEEQKEPVAEKKEESAPTAKPEEKK